MMYNQPDLPLKSVFGGVSGFVTKPQIGLTSAIWADLNEIFGMLFEGIAQPGQEQHVLPTVQPV